MRKLRIQKVRQLQYMAVRLQILCVCFLSIVLYCVVVSSSSHSKTEEEAAAGSGAGGALSKSSNAPGRKG